MNNATSHVQLCPIYAITDTRLLSGNRLMDGVKAALKAGITTIQYRDKTSSAQQKRQNAQNLMALCTDFDAQLIINDDVNLAVEVQAHGVHLGQEDGSVTRARSLLGDDAIIGVTCHNSIELAQQATEHSANYVAFGRFYSSTTKPEAQLATPDILKKAQQTFNLPIVAIGGINTYNAKRLWEHGAHSLAVCHSLFGAEDIHKAALDLLAVVKTPTANI